MRVRFLGTSGSTFDRGNMPPSILVDGDILLDCPAPCPYALSEEVEFTDLRIYLTHMHVDHSLGLIDLAWHLWISEHGPVRVYMPRESVAAAKELFSAVHPRWRELWDTLDVVGVEPGERLGDVTVAPARHTVPAVGYIVERGGARLCYSGDTAPLPVHEEVYRECSLLVYDSTYPPGREKEAAADGHSTPLQAAEVALRSGSSRLALIHIPTARLGPGVVEEYLKAARRVFPRVFAPRAGDVVEL